jgi:hypothetical protein
MIADNAVGPGMVPFRSDPYRRHPEERALARVSKDGEGRDHPSRLAEVGSHLRMTYIMNMSLLSQVRQPVLMRVPPLEAHQFV